MLTSSQREKCRRIAESLDAGVDASCDHLTHAEKVEVWHQRQHVREQAERRRQRLTAQAIYPAARPARIEREVLSLSSDLDYWPVASDDDEVLPGHDDDDTEQRETTCPTCRGTGRDHSGDTCQQCGGSGRVPVGPDDEDGDEEALSFYGHIEDEE